MHFFHPNILLARCGSLNLDAALQSVFAGIKGAFSMLLMVDNTLVAVRDPHGFRPLCLGRLPEGGYVVASETCALDLIEAQYLRDIEPGEILLVDADGLRSINLVKEQPRFCVFEQVYFARPDSTIFGIDVYQSRKRMGEALAGECRVDADMVIPFPDSGTFAALGYAQAAGIPFEMGLIRNHYIGRTFLPSARTDRDLAVRVKLNPVRSLLHGKRVVIVDDSAISGVTVASKVRALRKAGAREVHLLVSCPPIRFPCDYGIHFPARDKLLATGKSFDRIRDKLGLDTLHYLSLEGLLKAAGGGESSYCTACMDSGSPLTHGSEMP
ncbi:MAG: amidophosphoribosyltransferase [Desulfurivibrionaceae bacterium]|nr:amidophosphoribosyltransferase [Desulfurivibrionaceae bacterium]